jgi:hypothetical protein
MKRRRKIGGIRYRWQAGSRKWAQKEGGGGVGVG